MLKGRMTAIDLMGTAIQPSAHISEYNGIKCENKVGS